MSNEEKRYDFFPKEKVFGGMWDSLLVDEKGKPQTVLEFKTTKRSEDWAEDVPEYYALQAALYAYLLGVDDLIGQENRQNCREEGMWNNAIACRILEVLSDISARNFELLRIGRER